MTSKIADLTPKEVLALAIHLERANGRRLRRFAGAMETYDEQASEKFLELAEEEDRHEAWLTEKFNRRFEGPIPSIGDSKVAELMKTLEWDNPEGRIFGSLRAENAYRMALEAENKARDFYQEAVSAAGDKSLALLFRMLAAMEKDHVAWLEGRIRDAARKTSRMGGTR